MIVDEKRHEAFEPGRVAPRRRFIALPVGVEGDDEEMVVVLTEERIRGPAAIVARGHTPLPQEIDDALEMARHRTQVRELRDHELPPSCARSLLRPESRAEGRPEGTG
jgi:hypothetical protein